MKPNSWLPGVEGEGEMTKGHNYTFAGEGYIYYSLGCGDGFLRVYMCVKICQIAHFWYVSLCISIVLQRLFLKRSLICSECHLNTIKVPAYNDGQECSGNTTYDNSLTGQQLSARAQGTGKSRFSPTTASSCLLTLGRFLNLCPSQILNCNKELITVSIRYSCWGN